MSTILDLDSQMYFADVEALKIWFRDHAQLHVNYAANLFSIYKIQSPLIDLNDDGAMNDWIEAMQKKTEGVMSNRLQSWLFAHQKIHAAELQAINAGNTIDLVTVDFRDMNQFYDWMNNHQQLHDVEDTIL